VTTTRWTGAAGGGEPATTAPCFAFASVLRRPREKDFVLAPAKGAPTGRRLSCWSMWPFLALATLPLGGCGSETYRLFHPKGPVAAAMWHFTLIDVGVMLLIILPTWVMLCLFIWRYRKRANATYDPDWSHSMVIELLIWGAPVVIVAMLAFFSYQSVIQVNPYDPGVLADPQANGAAAQAPLEIDVVTTDWQWFFIYPQQRIATIDELVVP
jgi:cytochrome o ubiquinol oxidase subunit 2